MERTLKNLQWFVWSMCFSLTCFLVVPALSAQTSMPVSAQEIDQLSMKSDRWLFIAALVLLLSFGGMVMKWLITQLEKQRDSNSKAQEQLIDYLKNSNTQMVGALQNNTVALEKTNATNEKVLAICSNIQVDLARGWDRLDK